MTDPSGDRSDERAGTGESAHDPIGNLIQLAGRRTSLPDAAAARVKSHVRAHWRREVSRRRRLPLALAAAAAMLLIVVAARLWLLPPAAPVASPPAPAHVATVSGAAWRSPASGLSRIPAVVLRAGEPLAMGDELSTEEGARAALRAASGHSIRLDGRSRIRIQSVRRIELISGAVYLDSGGAAAGASLEVVTTYGVVQEVGTQFEVRLHGSGLRVRVREGSVRLHAAGGELEVAAGSQADLDLQGALRRQAMPAFGAEWAWMEGIAPMMDLKGRTLREFLEWASRERGLRLGFQERAAAEEASRITLSGSIQGLTIEEALAAVLPTCRMSHRVEDDMLVLEAYRDAGGGV